MGSKDALGPRGCLRSRKTQFLQQHTWLMEEHQHTKHLIFYLPAHFPAACIVLPLLPSGKTVPRSGEILASERLPASSQHFHCIFSKPKHLFLTQFSSNSTFKQTAIFLSHVPPDYLPELTCHLHNFQISGI